MFPVEALLQLRAQQHQRLVRQRACRRTGRRIDALQGIDQRSGLLAQFGLALAVELRHALQQAR